MAFWEPVMAWARRSLDDRRLQVFVTNRHPDRQMEFVVDAADLDLLPLTPTPGQHSASRFVSGERRICERSSMA